MSKDIKMKECLFLGDTVLLREVDRPTSQGGMYIPTNTSMDDTHYGEIMWVGTDVEYCRVGHHVLYKSHSVTPVVIEGANFIMAKEVRDITTITDFFADTANVSALISKVHIKRLAKEIMATMQDLHPDIEKVLEKVIQTSADKK